MRKKWLLASLLLTTALSVGGLAACNNSNGSDPSTPSGSVNTPLELDVELDATLSLMEGQVLMFDFTSNVERTSFTNIQWNSSAQDILLAEKQADGSVKLTANKVGTSTLTLHILYEREVKTYTCSVTVAEYSNTALRVFYNLNTSATEYEISIDQPTEGYAYASKATITVKPTKGYLFTSVNVGANRFNAEDFTKNADGTYTYVFDVLEKPAADETEINVDVVVNAGEIRVTTKNSSYTLITGLPTDGKYVMNEETQFSVDYVGGLTDTSEYIKSVWFNGEELTETNGVYTISITEAVNTLEVKAGKKHSSGSIQVVTAGSEYSGNNPLPTSSNKGVMISKFGYTNALGADPYSFGIRLYPGDTYTGMAHFLLTWNGNELSFIDEKTPTNKYVFENVAETKAKLLDGAFGVVVVRNVSEYALYVMDGDELKLAFNTSYNDAETWYRTGINIKATTPAGSTLTYSYDYYDGETDYTPYVSITPEVVAGNASVSGLTMNGNDYEEVSLWNDITFTVTPAAGYEIASVSINGVILEGTATGTDGAYTYTYSVVEVGKVTIEVEAVDPNLAATLTFTKAEEISIVYVEGEKSEYTATNVVKFKLASSDDFLNVKKVEINGTELKPVNGVYTLTLVGGANDVVIDVGSARVSGSASGSRYKTSETATSWENTLPDNRSGISTAIASPSGTNTLVAKVQFAEANLQKKANWYIDFRFYGDEAKAKFLAISIGKNETGVYVSSRTSQLKYFKDASPNANDAEILNLLENGEFRIAIVKTINKSYAIYADDGSGAMAYIGTLVGVGAITDDQTYEYIAFGGTSTNLSDVTEGGTTKYQSATTSISWGYYDGITNWELAAGDFFKDSDITPDVSAENATVSGVENSYRFGDTISFTVAPMHGYAIVSVKLNGQELTATGGEYSAVLKSVNCQIEIVTILDSITPTITLEGNVTQNGLLTQYQFGDTATFTVNADANAVVTVTVNGEVIVADNGTYTFTVGTTADIVIRAINQTKATVALEYNSAEYTVSGVDTTVDHYNVGDEVIFDISVNTFNGNIISSITHNGVVVTAQSDGSYKITLAAGENKIVITQLAQRGTATAKAPASTQLGTSGLYEGATSKAITATEGSATIAILSYAGAETNENAWRVEFRIHDSAFVGFGFENKSTGLVFQNRSANTTLHTFSATEAAYVKAQLVAGTLVTVIEKTTTGYAFYVATSEGVLTKVGEAARTTTDAIQYGIGNRNVREGEEVLASFYTYAADYADEAITFAALIA